MTWPLLAYDKRTFDKIRVGSEEILVGPCSAVEPARAIIVSLNGSSKDISVHINDFSVEPLEGLKAAILAAMRIASLPERRYTVGFCCGQGCGRTGTAAIIYMMARFGLPLEEALRKFYEARRCGPESLDQKLLLGYAELLRRRGLRGEGLVKALKLPKGRITPSERVEVSGVSLASWIIEVIPRIVRDIAAAIKPGRVKAPPDLASIVAREAGLELTDEDKEAMEAWRLWREAEEGLEKWILERASKGRESKKKGTKKIKKEADIEEKYDVLDEELTWWHSFGYK